jgi:hypothetical protein
MDTNTTFWSVGITLRYHPRSHNCCWSAEVVYRDNHTFTQEVAVEGRITTQLGELTQVIDRVMAAAQALGIVWRTDIPGCPSLYVAGSEDDDVQNELPAGLYDMVQLEAARLGWPVSD